ncbi:MAG: aldehyde dehydrogenase family protein [Deltaproteobacteria bacterium]|jgi:aldehyde dehydrogenase (NAD+)|nr:aldehyde dehydrogenase family protein [Deltaproteobacteria bacterium]
MRDRLEAMRVFYRRGITRPADFRLEALGRLHACLKRRESDLAASLLADLGKAPGEAYLTETGLVLGELSLLRRKLRSFMRPRRAGGGPALFPSRCEVRPEPLGLALIMAPWNYPVHLSLLPLADAVAAGNCVALKPSSRAPASASLIAEIAAECFQPEHVSVFNGAGATLGNELLRERWDFIFYTGSGKVGREVLTAAAPRLTPVCLELGGKSPVIVCADANLELAARRIAWGKTLNAGQTCVAPDYVLAHASVKNRLADYLQKEFDRFPGRGRAALDNPNYCRIVSRAALERLVELAAGRAEFDLQSLRLAPLLLPDARPEHPVMREEIFGPLLPLLAFNTTEEALAFVNDREKPLACYIFTATPQNAAALLDGIGSGGACVNDTVLQAAAHTLPFGGVGGSGLGRYHGRYGFELFSHLKSVVRRGTWCDPPLRYLPVAALALRLIRRFLR